MFSICPPKNRLNYQTKYKLKLALTVNTSDCIQVGLCYWGFENECLLYLRFTVFLKFGVETADISLPIVVTLSLPRRM